MNGNIKTLSDLVGACTDLSQMRFAREGNMCVRTTSGLMTAGECLDSLKPGPAKPTMYSCKNGGCVPDPKGTMTIERCWNDPLACKAPPSPPQPPQPSSGGELDCMCSCKPRMEQ